MNVFALRAKEAMGKKNLPFELIPLPVVGDA